MENEKKKTVCFKMKKFQKNFKNLKNEKIGFTRKILDDFHGFVSECVSFPRKINNPFWEVILFFRFSEEK